MSYYIQHKVSKLYLKRIRYVRSIENNCYVARPIMYKRRVVVHKNAINFWFRKKYDIEWDNWIVTPVKKTYKVVGEPKPFTSEFFIDKL